MSRPHTGKPSASVVFAVSVTSICERRQQLQLVSQKVSTSSILWKQGSTCSSFCKSCWANHCSFCSRIKKTVWSRCHPNLKPVLRKLQTMTQTLEPARHNHLNKPFKKPPWTVFLMLTTSFPMWPGSDFSKVFCLSTFQRTQKSK